MLLPSFTKVLEILRSSGLHRQTTILEWLKKLVFLLGDKGWDLFSATLFTLLPHLSPLKIGCTSVCSMVGFTNSENISAALFSIHTKLNTCFNFLFLFFIFHSLYLPDFI